MANYSYVEVANSGRIEHIPGEIAERQHCLWCFQCCTVKNEELLELLELAIYSFVIATNSCGEFK